MRFYVVPDCPILWIFREKIPQRKHVNSDSKAKTNEYVQTIKKIDNKNTLCTFGIAIGSRALVTQ